MTDMVLVFLHLMTIGKLILFPQNLMLFEKEGSLTDTSKDAFSIFFLCR